jgi:uncharacterized protein YdaU (DUF1376 family)
MAEKRLQGLFWWVDRWRASTAYVDLSLEEQGAYRNLLDEAWRRGGSIPNDERTLAMGCGDVRRWPKLKKRVMARFQLVNGSWHNETLDGVLAESRGRAARQKRYRDRQRGPSR